MNSVVRPLLGAAVLLAAGAVPAMAQYAGSSAPAATNQPVQAAAPTYAAPSANGYAAQPAPRPQQPKILNNDDPHGGHDPQSQAGINAFWRTQSNLY